MKSKGNGLFWLLALSFVIGLASLYASTSSGPSYEEQCTDPSAQGRGLQTLLARQVERGLRAGGYRTLRSTFVETANAGSSRTFERMGGRPLQGTTFYRRAVR